MNWTKKTSGLLLAALLSLSAWAGTARAGVDVDFGAAIRVGDDSDLFLRISSRYFDRDPEVVRECEGQYGDPDDAAVALFLSSHCGVPPTRIYELRRARLSWWQIGIRLGAPVDVWFVPVKYNPGPPYGNAYGHWRKYRHDRRHHFALNDREARDLVALRMMHDYYGVRPADAMRMRERDGSLRKLMANQYRERHGRDGHGPEFSGGDHRRERPARGGDTYRERPARGGDTYRGERGRDRGHGRDRGANTNDNSPRGHQGRDRGRD